MELSINVLSENDDAALDTATFIREDLEFFVPSAIVKQEEREIQKYEGGFNLLTTVVKVFADGDILIKVLKTLVERGLNWIGKQDEKIELGFKSADGTEATIVLENVKDLEKVLMLIEKMKVKSHGA